MIGKLVAWVFSLVLVVGVVIGIIVSVNSAEQEEEKISQRRMKVIQFCAHADYTDNCLRTLDGANTADPKELVEATIISTKDAVQKLYNLSDSMILEAVNNKDNNSKTDLEDCKDLLRFAIEDLQASLCAVRNSQLDNVHNRTDEMMAWLNAVTTYQQTCLDGFEGEKNPFKEKLQNNTEDARELTSNALSIINGLSAILESLGYKHQPIKNRRLLQIDNDEYPSWFSASDRKLLTQPAWEPNAVVAQDGSGQYKTIQEALDAYPKDLQGRYVIYIKAGIYEEVITVTKLQKNVLMYGDGMTKTIVTGSKSYSKGFNTMNTATFSAVGEGFIAKHMGFSNTAGPEGHQAVALRIQADRAAIFDCRMDGYQDTLYAHTYRQFYRNCVISGTIDFIFGDATAIIQNSWIIVRRPKDNQFNTVTAQGRDLNSQTTSLVIQNCTIVPDEKLWPDRWKIPTYLGRPWKEFAVTVFMENTFADFVQPDGYIPFKGNYATNNCKYYEYNNTGPGAWTDKRVNWPGVQSITRDEAQKFTVWALLQGDQWLKDTGIPYDLRLKYR